MNFLSERESIRRYFYEKYGLFVHVRRPDVTEQIRKKGAFLLNLVHSCLLYTSPSPRDRTRSRMPSSA